MRYVLSEYIPPYRRVLLVESGSRYLIEHMVPGVYACHPQVERVDLLTCFPGVPKNFDESKGRIYRTTDHVGRAARKALYAELRATGYDILGLVCSGEPIMTKWKWTLAYQVPAKTFVLNENGDYFFLDRGQWRTIKHFVLFRAGLSGAEGVATLARLLLFPFTFTFLLLYAAYAHIRRLAR